MAQKPTQDYFIDDDPNFAPDDSPNVEEHPAFEPESTQQPSFMQRAWNAASEPLVDMRSATPGLKQFTDQFAQEHPYIGKPLNFLTDTISGLSSPLNLGTTAMSGGSSLALKAGLPKIAEGLNYGTKALGAGMAVEGAKHIGDHPIIGGLELLGGIAGMKSRIPEIGTAANTTERAGLEGLNFDDLTNEHFPQDTNLHPDVPVTPRFNPRHIKGLSNVKQLTDGTVMDMKTGEVLEPEVILKEPTKEKVTSLRNKGYVPAGTTEEGYPKMKLGMPEEATVIRGTKSAPEPPHFDEEGKFIGDRAPEPNLEPTSKAREAYNLTRGLTTTFDLSAPGRQGLPLVSTKAWWGAWDDMLKSWGSEKAYRKVQDDILQRPLFKRALDAQGHEMNSFAEQNGLALTDLGSLTRREEALMSGWAEKVPGLGGTIRRSNRAYTAFLNQLRADHFEKLINDAETLGLNPRQDLTMSNKIADFVNNATGRGSLKFQGPAGKSLNLEQNAKLLNDVFFAPRLMSSRMAMLNPANYVMQPKFIRQQYLKAALTTAGAWGSIATLAKFGGADVSTDTTSADFGKIRLGNTRLDMGAGFQQYLVALSRFLQGGTTPTAGSRSGQYQEFGQGFNAQTRKESLEQFALNKTHPVLHLAYDLLNASKYRPFSVGDQVTKMYVPMIGSDLIQLAKDDPKLVPWLTPLIAVGAGTQTYDEKGQGQPVFPPELDYQFTGGGFGGQ